MSKGHHLRIRWTGGKPQDIYVNAAEHWAKHGGEFPELKSLSDYSRAVQQFISTPPKETLTAIRSNGDIVFYNPSTNVFAVSTSEGIPKTMFKPSAGMNYWIGQLGGRR